MNAVDQVLHGAVDMHTHSGPSPLPRRIDHPTAALQAEEAGLRAIVVKSHHHPTVMDVIAVQPWGLVDVKTQVFGGIALNNAVGGLNPWAVDQALKMGGKVVWFPTISSPAHIRHHEEHADDFKFPRPSVPLKPEEPIDIFGPDGDLRPQVHEIISLCVEAGAVISGGHMAPDRVIALFEAARKAGATRLLLSHPDFVIEATREQVSRMAELGAVIEHCLCMYDEDSSFFQGWSTEHLVDWIELVGPDRTQLGSDLGQVNQPLPVEALRKICGRLLAAGVREADVRKMVADNQVRLLGLD